MKTSGLFILYINIYKWMMLVLFTMSGGDENQVNNLMRPYYQQFCQRTHNAFEKQPGQHVSCCNFWKITRAFVLFNNSTNSPCPLLFVHFSPLTTFKGFSCAPGDSGTLGHTSISYQSVFLWNALIHLASFVQYFSLEAYWSSNFRLSKSNKLDNANI